MFISKNITVACLLVWVTFLPSYANSAAQAEGKVRMHGAIIDAACAISAGSQDQTIDMGTVPIGQLTRDGGSGSKSFSIELVNCILEHPRNKNHFSFFQITFDGYTDGSLFGLQGEARGVALKINNSNGTQVFPGKPLKMEEVIIGDRLMRYTMRLIPNNKPLKAGTFTSLVHFKLNYY